MRPQLTRLLLLGLLNLFAASGAFSAAPWLSTDRLGDVAYFLFAEPPRIERYDLAAGAPLSTLTVPETPTAFAVDADGIFVAFGRAVQRFDLAGGNRFHLRNTATDVRELLLILSNVFIIYDEASVLVVSKSAGDIIDSKTLDGGLVGACASPNNYRFFARDTSLVTGFTVMVTLLTIPEGVINARSFKRDGERPDASHTYLFADETRIVDEAGFVSSIIDLSDAGSFGGPFDDLDFHGDQPILLRGSNIVRLARTFVQTGLTQPPLAPHKIFVRDESVYSFYGSPALGEVQILPLPGIDPSFRANGDLDADGCTNLSDLMFMLDHWSESVSSEIIGIPDFLNMLDNWNTGPACGL